MAIQLHATRTGCPSSPGPVNDTTWTPAAVIDRARTLLIPLAAGCEPVQGYYIDDFDHEQADYCKGCALKRLAELYPDGEEDGAGLARSGDYDTDGPLRCETCGANLFWSPTEYAVESETDHYRREGLSLLMDRPGEVADVLTALDSCCLTGAPGDDADRAALRLAVQVVMEMEAI